MVHAFLTEASKAKRIFAIWYTMQPSTELELPLEYEEFWDIFSEEEVNKLASRGWQDHAIEIVSKPPYGLIYNLSEKELKTLWEYLAEALDRGWIRESSSPAGAPILFVPKKSSELQLCVDYQGLNCLTIKNQYPLPLIGELIDCLSKAKCYMKLDL